MDEIAEEIGGIGRITAEILKTELLSDARVAYQEREAELGSETMRELERRVVLSVVGRKWQEHLYEMDYLKEGIGLRAMAQRDPLVEYQREGFEMFQSMMAAIREESVGFLFNLDVQVENAPATAVGVVGEQPAALMDRVAGAASSDGDHAAPRITAPGLEAPAKPVQLQFTAPDAQGDAETHVERRSTGAGLPPSAKKAGNKTAKKKKKR